ncbi:hypothetical protein D8674_035257 [Pyrus ussuriensis x Pyrus communis]|uniref:Jacalin-type lectin domain-containing protein n=1 Tax=Pyrus ussuriensis x Pyrus communis TaxID=2448454 RepID=A0A5N5GGG5_9ROSA|nr:hypothetical protein D8674_035257 [Pyrus ussuriensis x Pyrus communis]
MNLITSCPQINDLRLILCTGLIICRFQCHGLALIEIKAPSLETFWFCGKKNMPCKINLAECESLKRLTLEDNGMTDNQFRDRFFMFPLLEKLDLHKCLNLKNIRIASHRLKRLVLRGCKKLADVEIDTPNLLSFEYEGDEMPFSFLNPISLKEAKFSFAPVKNVISEPEWFLKMRKFLGKLDHRDFKLVVYTNKNVIIHENLREISLPPNCGLKFELVQSSVGTEELLDSSLQKRQLETLSIVWSSGSEFLKQAGEKRKIMEVGPWGGNGGTPWDDGIYNGVREITLVYGHCIDSITVVYDKNGKPFKAETRGGRGGNQTAEIKLQYPDEYIVSVTGHYGTMVYGGTPIIRSLKFQSNRRTFGPFGMDEGTPFTYTLDRSKIVGLKGRNGWYIDAIGFHVSPAPARLFDRVQKSFRRLGSSIMEVGPWRGNGGTPWDDGIYNGVREITLVYGHCIDSITIKLQYPDEYIVSVTGHYCTMVDAGVYSPIIRLLKFQSNRRTFGPFGMDEGTPFTYTLDRSKIVGLKGRNGWYIDAIGFHVSPAPARLFDRVQKSFRRLGSSVTFGAQRN